MTDEKTEKPAEKFEHVEIERNSKWGYDMYPERQSKYDPSWTEVIFGIRRDRPLDKMKCERTVYECWKTNKLVKLMASALNSSGCPVDIRRHISCEICDPAVTGGYDPLLNQGFVVSDQESLMWTVGVFPSLAITFERIELET